MIDLNSENFLLKIAYDKKVQSQYKKPLSIVTL